MTPDRTRCCELLVGLERVEVLHVVRRFDRLFVTVESTDRLVGCSADRVPRSGVIRRRL